MTLLAETPVSKLSGIVFSLDNRHPDRTPAAAAIMSPPLDLPSFRDSLVSPSLRLSVCPTAPMEPELCLGIFTKHSPDISNDN